MKQMKYYFLFFISLFISLPIFASNGITSNPNWYIRPAVYKSVLIAHRSTLVALVKGYPTTYELNIVKPTSGSHLWHHENNFPEIGINLTVTDYANPKQLGYSFIIAPFADIPLNKIVKPSRVHLRLCWGAAVITKPFDIKTNQKNAAIGSMLNTYVNFKFSWHLKINDQLRLEPGFFLSHISNAAARLPNLGLNLVGFGLAMNFGKLQIAGSAEKIDSSTQRKSRNEFTVMQYLGFNEYIETNKNCLLEMLSFAYSYNVRNTHTFSIGADFMYEEKYKYILQEKGYGTGFFDVVRFGPKVGYAYNLGRLSFPIEVGVYAKQSLAFNGSVFNRLAVRYCGSKGLILAFGLRAHYAVANNLELGIGYRFNCKK